ncbi:3183_t:CDS:1, partial [Scutellospora calospora]
MSNNLPAENQEKIESLSNNITQITDNFNQLYLGDNNKSLDYFDEIIQELFNLYDKERSKGKNSELILNTLNQFLLKNKQNSND